MALRNQSLSLDGDDAKSSFSPCIAACDQKVARTSEVEHLVEMVARRRCPQMHRWRSLWQIY